MVKRSSHRRPPDPLIAPQPQRELVGLLELLSCPVRQRIILAPACEGPANVNALARGTSICQKTLSHHLKPLRTAGMVFSQRRGKEIWYEVTEDRARFQREPTGKLSLTISAPGCGAAVMITVGG